eukprot:GHVQ01001754.1.p1 GENE.GHVQ01001754.1~~GHVQ01001754.1.p1  ORF type:complete len:110 (+),score=8.36 GHVQ01001754.1:141-470(+)
MINFFLPVLVLRYCLCTDHRFCRIVQRHDMPITTIATINNHPLRSRITTLAMMWVIHTADIHFFSAFLVRMFTFSPLTQTSYYCRLRTAPRLCHTTQTTVLGENVVDVV